MFYIKPQLGINKLNGKAVLGMDSVNDTLGIDSDKKGRKPKKPQDDLVQANYYNSSDEQVLRSSWEHFKELFFLVRSSLLEEETDDSYDSIYESYWRQMFEKYYS